MHHNHFQGLRFRPPPVALTADLRWLLLSAFAPPGAVAPAPVDRRAAVALAHRLGVAARIGLRTGEPTCVEARRAAATAQMLTPLVAMEVAAAAAAAGVPCCFLKGAALALLGAIEVGGRPSCDLDVLVPAKGTTPLLAALAVRGFVPAMGEAYAHHLAPLLHPRFGALEVHTELPGVRVRGQDGFASFESLVAAGLLERRADLPGQAHVPTAPALIAHLLAHALAQHGFRPDGYPSLRIVGDLIDLGVGEAAGDAAFDAALPLVAGSVSPVEARAAAAVAVALAAGRPEVALEDSAAGTMLRHWLAGALDESYRTWLKLRELASPLAARSRLGAQIGAAWSALALSRRQIDTIYGPPHNGWGYLGWRLWRPLDLVARAWRSALARPRS